MFWISTSLIVLSIPALHVHARQADTSSFDVSPLSIKECSGRPLNSCGPQSIGQSDCAFLEPRDGSGMGRMVQEFEDNADNSSFLINDAQEKRTFITLDCAYLDGSQDISKEDLAKQVKVIRKRSPRRAVNLNLKDDAVLDPEIFVPISHQIVLLSLSFCKNSTITSRLPTLNFTNLVDFTMSFGRVVITIRRADFISASTIRCIRFYDIRFDTIEFGTFTDLPELAMFAIEATLYEFAFENLRAWHRLQCDPQFSWLWNWLEKLPGLAQNRKKGEVYKIGSLESFDATGMLTRNCTQSPTTRRPRLTQSFIFVEPVLLSFVEPVDGSAEP